MRICANCSDPGSKAGQGEPGIVCRIFTPDFAEKKLFTLTKKLPESAFSIRKIPILAVLFQESYLDIPLVVLAAFF